MGSKSKRAAPATAVLIGALWLPAHALAAPPTVTTGGATQIAQTTATLHGTVDPNGTATSYMFQIGPTRLYAGKTAVTSAGAGRKPVRAVGRISGAAPATRYHYRLVALRGSNVWFGKDRTFKTKPQPLGVSLAATPNPIRTGRSTTLAGVLSGTGNAGRQVQLQANPWPYTGGFQPAANNQVTSSTGSFAFPILSVGINTQYRVLMPTRPNVVSPIVVLGTTAKVTRHATVRRGTRRGRIHFYGRITPAEDGARVLIQKVRHGAFTTIKETVARHTTHGRSRYSTRVRQKHGGRYRVVVVDPTFKHSISVSRSITRRHVRK
jgi:hypothetical protein